jgi:hypothetical protein
LASRYHQAMASRLVALAILGIAAPAAADTLGGFSKIDRHYLVNQDRVCVPLKVDGGTASGAAKCEKLAADAVAKMDFKDPIIQRGAKAAFAATASGTTLTVTKKSGEPIVTWTAPDPISKVVEVYTAQYDDRVAVTYTVRRAGRELTDVIAFDLLKPGGAVPPDPSASNPPPTTQQPTQPAPPEDPKVAAAVKAARAAQPAKQLAAWKAVLALDPAHAEALYRIAANHAAAKRAQDALDTLNQLANTKRDDAIEWLVEARFDAAFSALRGDAKFRGVTGLDRKGQTPYERFMGFGGQWEQNGTSCDRPQVSLVALRDRTFKLRVKTACEGHIFDTPFKGWWRLDGDKVTLIVPTNGKATAKDEAPCKFETVGDEDALHCMMGHDIDFTALPTRR